MSCNGSGFFKASLTTGLSGFTLGNDRHFSFDNASIAIQRESTGKPVDFTMKADFCGMSNLNIYSHYQISPFSNFSATVNFTDVQNVRLPNNKRRRNVGMLLFSPVICYFVFTFEQWLRMDWQPTVLVIFLLHLVVTPKQLQQVHKIWISQAT